MKRKLWFRILLLFLFGILLPMALLMGVVNSILAGQMHETFSQKIQNDLDITSLGVDNILDSAQYSLGPLWADTALQNNLARLKPFDQRTEPSEYRRSNAILEAMNESLARNIFLFSLDLYSFRGKTMFSTSTFARQHNIQNDFDLTSSIWYEGYLNNLLGGSNWSALRYVYDDEPQLIKYYPQMSNAGATLEQIYSVSVSRQTILSSLPTDQFAPGSTFFLLDSTGSLFLKLGPLNRADLEHAQEIALGLQRIPAVEIGGSRYFPYRHTSERSGLQYLFLVPVDVASNYGAISTFYGLTVLIMLLVVVLFAVLIAVRYGVHPITRLFKAMQQVEKGNFDVRLPEERTDEVGAISLHFNQMVSRLDGLIRDNIAMEAQEKDLELKFILSQLNEHFLYNTLDSIHWSARKQNNEEICQVVSRLSRFYRNTLSNGQDIIPVAQVREIIESYLYVQKFRMQERLTYRIEADPGLETCRVLKYLFQPIVENAVHHGVSCRAQGGHVEIRFTRQGQRLCFSVEDTGYGIPREKLEEIKARIQSGEASDSCFALRNVNAQLAHYYGPDCCLHMESQEGVGTRVWFWIPIEF